jgi:replication factor A1
MKIAELSDGATNVVVDAKITDVEAPREVMTKFGRRLKVANATIQDDSGEFTLVLWGDDSERVKTGDAVHIENGYVSSYKGKMQLTVGKYGKLEVVG